MPRSPTHHKGYANGGPGAQNDLVACGHCTAQLDVAPRAIPVGVGVPMCRNCMTFLCTPCEEKRLMSGCVTWEAMIERMEREGHAKAKLAKELGLEE